jgi:hypothetical protein
MHFTFCIKKIQLVLALVIYSVAGLAQDSLTLSGKVPTTYSKGYELRAITCQQLITIAETFYEQKYPQYHFTTGLKILDKSDWQKLGYNMPYGMPHYRNAIVMAAEKNGVFPDSSSDTTISPYDAIAVHELGHYFMGDLVKTDIYPNWANEFIATYFQVIYASAKGLNITILDKPGYTPGVKQIAAFDLLHNLDSTVFNNWLLEMK